MRKISVTIASESHEKLNYFSISASAALVVLFTVSFQLGFLSLFQPVITENIVLWPIFYYGAWLLAVFSLFASAITNCVLRKKFIAVILLCALAVSFTFLHPFEFISKNFIVSVFFFACATGLAMVSGPMLALRLLAFTVALSAVICLADAFFTDGFTNTIGRAAGLMINPNVAAAALLLGATAAYHAVSPQWRLSFIVLIGTALLATLSRSTALCAILVALMAPCIHILRFGMRRIWQSDIWHGAKRAAFLAIIFLIVIYAALSTNSRFQVAALNAAQGIISEKSLNYISNLEYFHDDVIKLGKMAHSAGKDNSVLARSILLHRSLIAYETGPRLGIGLERAYALQPHNTYLLFMVAFGTAGIIIPLSILASLFYIGWKAQRLSFPLAFSSVMLFTHDAPFSMGLLLPAALWSASILKREPQSLDEAKLAKNSMSAAALLISSAIIIFTLNIVLKFERTYITRMNPDEIFIHPDGSYWTEVKHPSKVPGLMRLSGDADYLGPTGQRPGLYENGSLVFSWDCQQQSDNVKCGMYSRNHIKFSLPDGTDPRYNGRNYDLIFKTEAHPLIFVILSLIIVWLFSVCQNFRHFTYGTKR